VCAKDQTSLEQSPSLAGRACSHSEYPPAAGRRGGMAVVKSGRDDDAACCLDVSAPPVATGTAHQRHQKGSSPTAPAKFGKLRPSNTFNMADSVKLPSVLAAQPEDIQLLLAAQCHIGTKNCDKSMENYVWKRRADGECDEGMEGEGSAGSGHIRKRIWRTWVGQD
jgi:hypothetical protein